MFLGDNVIYGTNSTVSVALSPPLLCTRNLSDIYEDLHFPVHCLHEVIRMAGFKQNMFMQAECVH